MTSWTDAAGTTYSWEGRLEEMTPVAVTLSDGTELGTRSLGSWDRMAHGDLMERMAEEGVLK